MKSEKDVRYDRISNSFPQTASLTVSWCFLLKACILVKTETGKHGAVAKKLSQNLGAKICFPVLGMADVVLKVEVRDMEELTRFVQGILLVRGVSETETLVESGV